MNVPNSNLRSFGLLCLALFCGINAAGAESPPIDAKARSGDAAAAQNQRDEARKLVLGRTVFVNNCAACHGNQGRGHGAAAIALTRRPADLTAADIGGLGGDYLLTAVGNGRRSMPAFDKILTEEQEQAVVTYVISLSAKPKQVEHAGRPERGEK